MDEELRDLVDRLRAAGTDLADIEAKRAATDLPKSVRESVSAFANTAGGGVLILGLSEDEGFAVTGTSNPQKVSADLAAMCSNDMEPVVRATINVQQLEGASVVVAEIPEEDPAQKPCFYKPAGMTNGSFIRVADGDYRLNSYEVQMILSSRGQPREDEKPVADATIADLDMNAVQNLLNRVRHTRPVAFRDIGDEDALRRMHVLVQLDGGLVPSVAGLLSLGQYPQDRFPQLNLTFVHYPTPTGIDVATGERFLDNRTIEGSIPEMVQQSLAAVKVNMTRRGNVSGAGRQDIWEYPETALREAIVNALCHRDLSPSSHGTPVQVEMYPDRLLVRNPGGLFGPVNVYQLGEEGVSSSRNAVLLKILEDVTVPGDTRTVCENRGSGIKAMIQSLRAADMGIPEFTSRVASFQVAFPNHTLMSPQTVAWIEQLSQEGLTPSQCLGLALMGDGRTLTNATYRASTGVDSRVATTELQDLVTRRLADRAGVRRWSSYSIAPAALLGPRRVAPKRLSAADRRAQILNILGDETRSRAEIVAATGLSPQTVRGWLLRLRNEGAIEIIGAPQSNKARYRALQPAPGTGIQMTLDAANGEGTKS